MEPPGTQLLDPALPTEGWLPGSVSNGLTAVRRKRPGAPLLRGLLAVALVGLLVLIVWWTVSTRADGPGNAVTASGFAEADEVLLSSQTAALIVDLPVAAGGRVTAGTVLARLDDAGIQLQLRLADGASREGLLLEADKYLIRSPLDGIVTRVPAHVGEQALPGRALVGVANPAKLNVLLYVPLRDLGTVHVGQTVDIAVDALANRQLSGVVASINNTAEFTPRNVQTQPDRLNLVYGVTVRVDNRNGDLKAGMPVQATFVGAGAP